MSAAYEEIHRIVQAAAGLGVKKLRLTGGEALMRLDLQRLVEMLAHTEGIDEVSLTTNGTRLARHVDELKAAGLSRVNVSLDSLKPDRFEQITGSDRLKDVLEGIEAARKAGLGPVKINMVVLRGVNDDEVLGFARKTLSNGWHVRFIEHMPFVNGNMQKIDAFRILIEGVVKQVSRTRGEEQVEFARPGKTEQFPDVLTQERLPPLEAGHEHR